MNQPPAREFRGSLGALTAPLTACAVLISILTISISTFGQPFAEAVTGMPGIRNGSVAWGDFDDDGDLDLLIAGDTGNGAITRMYRNEGGNVFMETATNLPGISSGAITWGDYNGDGYLDFAMSGNTSAGGISRIYRNNGDDTFSDIIASIPGLEAPRSCGATTTMTVTWMCFSRATTAPLTSERFTATMAATRSPTAASPIFPAAPRVRRRGATLIATAISTWFSPRSLATPPTAKVRLFRNTNGTFTNITSIALTAMSYASVAWGDYNNDNAHRRTVDRGD